MTASTGLFIIRSSTSSPRPHTYTHTLLSVAHKGYCLLDQNYRAEFIPAVPLCAKLKKCWSSNLNSAYTPSKRGTLLYFIGRLLHGHNI